MICFVCNLAVLVANLKFQVKVPGVGAKTYQVSGEDRKGRKEGEEIFFWKEKKKKGEERFRKMDVREEAFPFVWKEQGRRALSTLTLM